MRIAVDTSPIDSYSKSAHKVRGVGKYINLLKNNLERFDSKNTYIFTPYTDKVESDIVHYPYFDPFFITLPLVKKRKTVVTVHDVIPLVHKKEFPVGLRGEAKLQVNKFLLNKCDRIITDSYASQEDIQTVLNVPIDKIFPVYLSVDDFYAKKQITLTDKKDLIRKYLLPEKFVMYVGDVTWNKNLPRLVEAVKLTQVPLVMVGKAILEPRFDIHNPWNKDKVKVMIGTQNDPNFIKLGFVPDEDLALLYNIAQALIMPSLDEGFGLPILEAMRSGCPVVTSRFGSLPEVGGDAVLYVNALDINDIKSGIHQITTDESLRNKCIEKGYTQAAKFSLKKMVQDTVKVYESVAL